MRRVCTLLAVAAACLPAAWAAAEPAGPDPPLTLLLTGLDATEGLSGTGTWTTDAECKQGTGSIKWSVGAGTKHMLHHDFAGRGIEAAEWDELRFRYKVLAAGWTWLGVKLVDHPVGKGMQATWRIGEAKTLEPGGWREAVVDLARPMYLWGTEPDKTAQWFCFRAMADRPAAILLDDVRLTRRALRTRIVRATTTRGPEGRAVCRWTIEVANATRAARRVQVTLDARGLRTFSGKLSSKELALEGGKAALVEATLTSPPAARSAAKPLSTERAVVRFRVPMKPKSVDYSLELEAVVPIALPGHPCLLVTKKHVQAIKAKVAKHPWAKQAYDKLIADADAALKRTLDIPPRGGQWWHWYSCPKDGTGLKSLSPTRHQCPTCKKVYTGEPYDSVHLNRAHSQNARDAETLGLAYQFTANSRYAAKAAEILLAYAGKYLTFPRHNIHGQDRRGGGRVGPQTLDESTWLIPVVRGYDLVWETLSPEQREAIETKLLRPAAELILDHKIGIHNIQCWKNSAVGLVGICVDEPRFLADAVTSERGIREQLAKGILDDGSWYEGAWGYHYYTMSALWPLAEALRNIGMDAYTDRYERFYAAPIQFALPNGRLPAFNDSRESNGYGPWTRYELANARWKSPLFAAMLKDRPRNSRESLLFGTPELDAAAQLPRGSRNYPVSGYAYLQCGESVDGPVAILDYAPHGGGHGHPEKLQLLFYARGEIIAPDPGCIAYGVPLHREWYRHTIAHNTVAVDGRSQKPCQGKLAFFHATPEMALVRASADDACDGVRFARTVALLPGGLAVDLVELDSKTAHDYDWAFHCYERLSTPLALSHDFAPPGTTNGYQHVRAPRGAACDGPVVARWTGAKAAVDMAMLAAPSSRVYAGQGHGQPSARKLPTLIVRRHGTGAFFATAFRIGAKAPRPTRLTRHPSADGQVRLHVEAGDEQALVLLPLAFSRLPAPSPAAELPEPLAVGTDARAAVVRLSKGKLRAIAFAEGKEVTAGKVGITAERAATVAFTYHPRGKSVVAFEGKTSARLSIRDLFAGNRAVATPEGTRVRSVWKQGILSFRATAGRYHIAAEPEPTPRKPAPND